MIEAAGLAALQMPLLPAELPPDRREMVRIAGAAVCALANVRNADAEKLIQELARSLPKRTRCSLSSGAFLLKQKPDEGIAEMQRELEISPDHAMARTRLADEYAKADKLDLALSLPGKRSHSIRHLRPHILRSVRYWSKPATCRKAFTRWRPRAISPPGCRGFTGIFPRRILRRGGRPTAPARQPSWNG